MNIKFKKVFAAALAFILICAGAQAAQVSKIALDAPLPFAEDAQLMYIYFFDIGAQDSFLVLCGGESMLIDCGTYKSGPRIAARLDKLGITHIDYALNTHPHDDHIDGFRLLSDSVTYGSFLTCFPPEENENQIETLALMREKGVEIIEITDQSDISFGGNSIWLYQDDETTNVNYRSLVMHVTFGEASALFLSDVGRVVHGRLYRQYGDALKADILKLPHHGITVPGADMTKTADPEICVLTNWNNNVTADTMKVVKSWKYPIAHTPLGTLEFVTDGTEWVYRQYPKIDD